jgi:oxygen-independent coproporphyrinogen-3 oxidase
VNEPLGQLAGLYLHVPFCERVCPYCDFAVRTGDRTRRLKYVDHLLDEIRLYAGYPLRFDTIYFGGGTPSSLGAEELGRVLDTARRELSFADPAWTFLEVNPEDVTDSAAAAWRGLGVDTLSLGLQALDAEALVFLGRRHRADDARRAVAMALEAGFHTVSIDLIYGLPGQSPDDWRRELDRALELGAHHFSCYQLTVHEKTRFGLLAKRGKLTELPDDEQAELLKLTHRHLEAAGLRGYEVGQFAVGPEHRSRHNLKYWNHVPYLGLGPSAHSYQGRERWWNLRRSDPWQERIARGERPVEGSETLSDEALALESLMTGLRTHAGVDLERLRSRWGVELLARNAELVERLQSEGLLRLEGERLVPTLDGMAVADAIPPLFEL